ncbi:MAG: hypothetical protein LCH89_07990 [Proteobacteria bacterium]|nr:hypothetical protein [Pseudomonadota bacterium]
MVLRPRFFNRATRCCISGGNDSQLGTWRGDWNSGTGSVSPARVRWIQTS